jgi:hypothetical protein
VSISVTTIATGSVRIYITKWRKRLRDSLKTAGVSRAEDLGVVDYVIASPDSVNEPSIAEKKTRGSKNGARNPKGNGEKGGRVPPGKGGRRPAPGGGLKVQLEKMNPAQSKS